ncbi:nucleoporin-domain-containing protein [Meredithblackwellia eburnea MCA 4105]
MAAVASTSTPSGVVVNQPPEDPTFGPLERAGKALDERLARDDRWLGLGDSLGGATSSDYVLPPNPAWAPFRKTRTVLLPDRLFEEHDLTQSRCSMGLLPEIERSWVTVDHRLLLWDWADGSSFSTFEELTDVIVGVGLVKPRPGVFVDSISHLLVLATPTQITLVGLGYAAPSPGTKREVTFYLTGLTVPTDGISLVTVRGTANGRIFLSSSPDQLTPGGIGGDGCLYELVYQSSEGWFSKKCSLYNLTSGSITKSIVPSFLRSLSAIASNDWIISLEVDNERGLLYTLLRNGVIEMYQLSSTAPGSGFDGPPNRVAKTGDVLRQAQVICPGSPMLNARNFRIVSLEVISLKEGGNLKIGLVAVTSTGVRLYFTHQRRGYSAYYSTSAQPATLELCHVRPPPAPSTAPAPPPNNMYGQPVPPAPAPASNTIAFNSVIQAKFASGGLLLAANNLTTDIDVLLLAAPDVATGARVVAEGVPQSAVTGASRPFSEVAGTIEIPGRTWDMAEITVKGPAPAPGGGTALNELATQVTQSRREWVVLTNMGANVVSRQRPVDTLLEVLQAAGLNGTGGGHGEVSVFFESYGRDQACAMLLTIAAGNSRVTNADSTAPGGGGLGRNAGSAVADHAKSLFFEGGGRPVSIDRGGYGSGPSVGASDSKVIFSGRHEGLAFYLARLIRPIWREKITRPAPTADDKSRQTTNVSEATLTAVQRDLVSLRAFVDQEQHLFTLVPDGGRSAHAAVAYQAEQASLAGLSRLLTQSVEAISFVLLLIDYKISDIIASCPPEIQKSLQTLTYQGLLTTKIGRDVARGLVSSVINQQIGRQLSVDAISDTLQQRCGSFCSADDVLLYKAIEAVRRAKDASDGGERVDSLREALRLYTKAAKHLSFDALKDVCADFNAMRYPLGVIDLALSCANEWDSAGRALSYWIDGEPLNDPRLPSFQLRSKCNQLVFAALEESDNLLNRAVQSDRSVSYEEADGLRSNAYNRALSVKDEFFHSSLYDWYLSRGLTDQLLETRTPYLEGYLSREPTTLEKSDLLWQLYVRTGRYAQAATILAALADTTVFPLSLAKRVEYLSLAVGNAKSQLPSTQGDAVQFLTEVEEKLEVAQVQIDIYAAVDKLPLSVIEDDKKREILDELEFRLYNISELYSDLAVPLNLYECQLLIFHVSDHRDASLIIDTWAAIFQRASESSEEPLRAIATTVVELGRRFHTSDVAFPFGDLVAVLEKLSLENQGQMGSGWVPQALHDAGVPWELVFDVFDDLFTAKNPPWHTNAASVFLADDIAALLKAWLEDADSPRPTSLTAVETAIGKMLLSLNGAGAAEGVIKRLQEIVYGLKRKF